METRYIAYEGYRSAPFSSMDSKRLIGSLSREISKFPSITPMVIFREISEKIERSPRTEEESGVSKFAVCEDDRFDPD